MLQKLLKGMAVQPKLSNFFSQSFQPNFNKFIEISNFPEKLKYADFFLFFFYLLFDCSTANIGSSLRLQSH